MQKGVEAREAELKKILSETHDLLRRRASRDTRAPSSTQPPTPPTTEITEVVPVIEPVAEPISNGTTASIAPPEEFPTEDMSNLQEQAQVLRDKNDYLDIPYDSIRILSGKENELGCGKAATVYRGLWINDNGAAEVRFFISMANLVGIWLTI